MLLVPLRDADTQPDLPDKDVARQLLAPRQGVIEDLTHDDLCEHDQRRTDEASAEEVFLQLVVAVDQLSEKAGLFHR